MTADVRDGCGAHASSDAAHISDTRFRSGASAFGGCVGGWVALISAAREQEKRDRSGSQ